MRKRIVHLYGESPRHTYTTVCGMRINSNYLDTTVKKKVTCKRCKRTRVYQNFKDYKWKDFEV